MHARSVEITKETKRHAPHVKVHCHATALIVQCILQFIKFNVNDCTKNMHMT
jgi:hypothetical protein